MTGNLMRDMLSVSKNVALAIDPPVSQIGKVKTLGGQTLHLPMRQIPDINPNTNSYNLWRYPAAGNITGMLSTGGTLNVKIDRNSGSGRVTGRVFQRWVITNTNVSNAVRIVPIPFLTNTATFQSPSGDVGQNWDGTSQWLTLISTFEQEKWQSMSNSVLSSDDYETGFQVSANTVYIFNMPIIGNQYSTSQVYIKPIDGDQQYYLTIGTPTQTVISGSGNDLSLTAFSLDMEMEQLDNSLQMDLLREYQAFDHQFVIPFMRMQPLTQTWSVSSQYTIPLTGIKGDVVAIFFLLRTSLNGKDLYHSKPISSFQIQDSQGLPITGAQFIDGDMNRWCQLPEWFHGTWQEIRNYYGFVFGKDKNTAIDFFRSGKKNGARAFNNNESLIINTAPAATNEIVTATISAGTAASGSFQLTWTTPHSQSWTTAPIAFNATGAQIEAAIEALPNFEGTVTVSGAITTSPTFTFSGAYGGKVLYNEGYVLSLAASTIATAAPALMSATFALTQTGIRGITNGATMTLNVYAFTSSIWGISEAGHTRYQQA